MYGRGKYSPQFGQGLQRPMPPYQQPAAGNGRPPALHFQPGQPFPMQPVMQQCGPHHGVPPRGPGYPPGPPNTMPQGPQGSGSNAGQSFVQRPQPPYPPGQFSIGAQNPHHVGPPPPPPPPSVGPPRVLPPPPLQCPAGFGPPGPQPTFSNQPSIHHASFPPLPPPPPQATIGFYPSMNAVSATQQSGVDSQMSPHPPPPSSTPPMAPLPPSSSSPLIVESQHKSDDGTGPNQTHELESAGEQKTDGQEGDGTSVSQKDLSLKQSVLLELPPPPKPVDDKVVRNIEVLCQFIAKNGPQFEEMARRNEAGNPDFCFLVGGDPGSEASCAREYYLWMKKKFGLLDNKGLEQTDVSQRYTDDTNLVEPSSFAGVRTTQSATDSDVDMEDDITQSDKEPTVYNSVEDISLDPASTGEGSEMQKQENTLQDSRDSSLARHLSLPVKSETMPDNSCSQPTRVDSPFSLIRNYASDDNSEDDDEPPLEKSKIKPVSPPHKSESLVSHDDIGDGNLKLKFGSSFEVKPPHSVTAVDRSLINHDSQAVLRESMGTLTKVFSPGKPGTDDRYGGAEPSNLNADFKGEYASGSSSVGTVSCGVIGRETKMSTAAAPNVDEFGRVKKEGASDSESDGSRRLRRRGRRDWSRSRSRSPVDRRRRSPRRRKDRRSRSRSWSPKRRRSRSRSPYRHGGDVNNDKQRRTNVQSRQCFDFLKGRCRRGALCRYLHHDVDKDESSNRSKNRPYHVDTAHARSSDYVENEHEGVKVREDVKRLATDGCDSRRDEVQVHGALEEPISQLPRDGDHSSSVRSATNQPLIKHISAETRSRSEVDPQAMLVATESDSSAMYTSMASPAVTESGQGKPCSESTGPSASIPNLPNQTSQLPPSPLASLPTNAQQELTGQADHSSTPPLNLPPMSIPVQSVSGYQGPFSTQHSQYPVPPNLERSNLPLPQQCPSQKFDPSISGASLQLSQGVIPLQNAFPDQTSSLAQPGHFHSTSQAGGFQYQAYQLPSSNVFGQPFTGPTLMRDDRSSQFSSHGHMPAGSFAPGGPPQLDPFPGDTSGRNMQSYPGSTILVAKSSKPALFNHQHPQPRLPPYGQSLITAGGGPSHLGGSLPVSGYASESLDKDRFRDGGGSRISTHYNPYASTFDQPLSTRFSSTVFPQERGSAAGVSYDDSFSLSSAPMGGQKSGALFSSISSRVGGHTLPRPGGDQYDPLFDSIEPSKRAQKLDQAADNSDMLKVSSHHKVLDVAENNKQKEVGAVVATTSFENDEYGETADAEVGAVENGSPSDPDDDAIAAEGEVEIDQVKSEGNSRKDSRSMKLFKVAVANFVKDVLKPQWRQGNMSKEVFKTIVKKTVDKVSGAMKKHRLPKSQAKIDHYIESSRRKLTHLVEGYVSKYKS